MRRAHVLKLRLHEKHRGSTSGVNARRPKGYANPAWPGTTPEGEIVNTAMQRERDPGGNRVFHQLATEGLQSAKMRGKDILSNDQMSITSALELSSDSNTWVPWATVNYTKDKSGG